MNNTVVFTEQSLYNYICNYEIKKVVETLSESKYCIQVELNQCIYYFSVSQKDKFFEKETLIVFKNIDEMFAFSEEYLHELFTKIHKYSHEVNVKKNRAIPHSWSPFRHKNKVSFFAFDNITRDNSKVILEIKGSSPNNILVHGVTDERRFSIEDYPYTEVEYDEAINNLGLASEKYKEKLEELKVNEMGDNLVFEHPIYNETNIYSFDEWKKRLAPVQKQFVNSSSKNAIKLRGPAGTGKTLAMEIKAIKLLESDSNCKILYLTHSWTVSDYVQNFLEQIIDADQLKRIDVFPLLSFAEMFVTHNNNIIVLGDDSFSGKIQQLKLIEDIVNDYKISNLAIYKNRFSNSFLEIVTTQNATITKSFYWDLMIEFACVIGANGIMPGLGAKEKYFKLERRPWMMTLINDADKEFVINIYQEFIKYLKCENKITSDQIINDYLNYLSTYNWYYDRVEKGYSFIFIDEMQLFNEQERMVLHYLTKNPDDYPILFMAMDPRQTVVETYFDYGITEINDFTEYEKSESTFGKTENLKLGEVFRYSKEILDFLKHIDKSFPALGLDSEWENDIKKAVSKKGSGSIPEILIANSVEDEIKFAFEKAKDYDSKGLRTAILSLTNDNYLLFKERCSSDKAMFIESREDTIKLQYKKRGIIISQSFYVIGLQFDVVIISGCYIYFREHDTNQSYNLRRFISDLYLGSSRASKHLFITTNIKTGSIPSFINTAVDSKYLKKVDK